MRLVDADEANKAIETVCNDYGIAYGNNYGGFADKIASVVDNIPTIDAEPVVHGHWILRIIGEGITRYPVYQCSVCGRAEFHREPYCNCGAKMDEEENVYEMS